MDKLTLGLIVVVAAVAAVVFLGPRKDDEEPQPRLSVDPRMVIKPPHTGDKGMAKQPPRTGDEGMVRPPTTSKTRTI